MFSCCSYYVISYEKSIMGSENTYASCVSRIMYVKNVYKTYIIKYTEINQMSSTEDVVGCDWRAFPNTF
jgi:hypothetical protein